MKVYVISVRIKHALLGSDTLHMFVQAQSWEDFASKANLEMWAPQEEDDIESWLAHAENGDWCPIKGRDSDQIRIAEHEAGKEFLAQLEKMEALMEFGGNPTRLSLYSF